MPRRAFTLIELLVVIAIIALLIGIIVPSLAMARKTAKSVNCLALLRGTGQALTLYNGDHKELVIPSYTMDGTSGVGVPFDGWGPLLDRDGYLVGAGAQLKRSPLCCPEAKDVPGLIAGQTGSNPDNPKGWMEWPCIRNGTGFDPITMPDRNLNKIVRVAYWINGDNPIGGGVASPQDTYYTGSVGFGPGANGLSITYTRLSAFVRPSTLVAVADGVYSGRQRDNRIGTPNCRIGFRHPGKGGGAANAAFADGHAASIDGGVFPRALGGSGTFEEVRLENINGQPTVYANPDKVFP